MEAVHLNELLKHVGISERLIDQCCSEEHIILLSASLKWRGVAPHLGLSAADIEEIEFDKNSESERRLKTLQMWKEKYAYKATYKNLIKALLTVGKASLAQDVCKLLKSEKGSFTTVSTPCPSTMHEHAITDTSMQPDDKGKDTGAATLTPPVSHANTQPQPKTTQNQLKSATVFPSSNICDQSSSPEDPVCSALLTTAQPMEQSITPQSEVPQPQASQPVTTEQKTEEYRFDIFDALLRAGVPHIVSLIMTYLSLSSLAVTEQVSTLWNGITQHLRIWRDEVQKNVETSPLWHTFFVKRGWHQYVSQEVPNPESMNYLYRQCHQGISKDIHALDTNWRRGQCTITKIKTGSEVFCLQFDSKRIVSGHRDRTIKIWDKDTLKLLKTLTGHKNTVWCLQFIDDIIISGSLDNSVKVWDTQTGLVINELLHHKHWVRSLKFKSELLVTGSDDWTVAVWEFKSPTDITLKMVLKGHQSLVLAVDISDSYIISGSRDHSIKVWDSSSGALLYTLQHSDSVRSLQCRGSLIVSGCFDGTIRLWDYETEDCLREWKGHEGGLMGINRCVAFDDEHIVIGSNDKTVKVWSMSAVLEPSSFKDQLWITTLKEHSDFVRAVQIDMFQVVSGSDDIIIYDFTPPPAPDHILVPPQLT